jgi:hypothetical protein
MVFRHWWCFSAIVGVFPPLLVFSPTISNGRNSVLSANFNNAVTNNIVRKACI